MMFVIIFKGELGELRVSFKWRQRGARGTVGWQRRRGRGLERGPGKRGLLRRPGASGARVCRARAQPAADETVRPTGDVQALRETERAVAEK